MQNTRRVLNVFLASPSDVAPERVQAEEVVAQVNKLAGRRFGIYIELYKWEDTVPGFGRPQEIINQMVDECDLFVGLLWERWGQPSGKYSSGFEEEYERAKARRQTGDKPDIWLVFKELEQSKLKDPGPQLSRVLEFRQKQTDLREVLFTTVKSGEEWKTKLQAWLLETVFNQIPLAPQQPTSTAATISSSSLQTASKENSETKIPQQLKSLSELLRHVLHAGRLEFSPAEGNPLQEFDVVRLLLFASTLTSNRYTNELLGTHDINLLYKHRHQLEPAEPEKFLLLRSVVGSSGDVQPGWFWFRGKSLRNSLLFMINSDSSDDVRVGALNLFAAARIQLSKELWSAIPFDENSVSVRGAAFRYAAAVGDESALELLDTLPTGEDPTLISAIRDARFEIVARLDPLKALSEAISNDEYLSDKQLNSLQTSVSSLDEAILTKGAESSWEETRKMAIAELVRRRGLSLALAKKFSEDPSPVIKELAWESLAMHGAISDIDTIHKAFKEDKSRLFSPLAALGGSESAVDVDNIIVAFYRTKSTRELIDDLNWFSPDTHLAYKVLALDRFDAIAPDLRSDLPNGFEHFKRESTEKMRTVFGKERWDKAAAPWDELHSFIRSKFTTVALLGLAANGTRDDAPIARLFLEDKNTSVRDAALRAIVRLGGEEDVDSLLKVAGEAYGTVKKQAAVAALQFSSSQLTIARQFIKNKDAAIAQLGFNVLYESDSVEARNIFEGLLQDTDDLNRIRALYYLSQHTKEPALEDLLKEYIKKDTYYYNVVTWLDRLLYSSSLFKQMYAKELEKQARQNG